MVTTMDEDFVLVARAEACRPEGGQLRGAQRDPAQRRELLPRHRAGGLRRAAGGAGLQLPGRATCCCRRC